MSAPNYGTEFIEAKLRRSAKIIDGQSEMEFTSVNGRTFVLREEDDGTYFAFEYIPTGRLAHEREDGNYDYSDWVGHEAAKGDPNGYMAAAEAAGISRNEIVSGGAGYGVYTRYLPSITEAAEEFARCIRENERYDDLDRAKMADPEFHEELKRSEEETSKAYWASQTAAHEYSMESEVALFKGLYGMMGPLSDGAKQRLLSFFNAPSQETWDDCARLMIKGGKTMWQLWCDVDQNAPRSLDGDWPAIPDVEMMRNALRALGDTAPDPSVPSRRF
jgi:hypothetical protein